MQDTILPGIPNIHSHAFQRAMAGLAERQRDPADSFWTWRELMYRFAGRIDPETQYAIAAQLYAEMLASGYTSVCEFHYLHHQPDGRPYADPAAMSQAIIAAARDTGIRLTLLPVLYMSGGFDGRALSERQQRFGHSVQDYLSLLAQLRALQDDTLRVGVALHSLRAVPAHALAEVLAAIGDQPLPVTIHCAERQAGVDECLAIRGARPVQWLLEHAAVDARWTLVHATHLTPGEVSAIAASQAVVALCPTTEANLGDGLFPLREFLAQDGRIGIGSDSNVSVSPVEELRWLEYGQRLALRQRNIGVSPMQTSTGRNLFERCVAGGLQSSQQVGQAGDTVHLAVASPLLAGVTEGDLHDRFVFAGNQPLVHAVVVAGRTVVRDGRHVDSADIAARYGKAMRTLLSGD